LQDSLSCVYFLRALLIRTKKEHKPHKSAEIIFYVKTNLPINIFVDDRECKSAVIKSRQLFILQGLPGVGRERADRLLDRFGSVEAAISASSSDVQSVNGIGKSIAEKIKLAVSERVSPYFTRPVGP